jgi:hypothetical protein
LCRFPTTIVALVVEIVIAMESQIVSTGTVMVTEFPIVMIDVRTTLTAASRIQTLLLRRPEEKRKVIIP